jgi:adenine-specific DNA-methyltransferase
MGDRPNLIFPITAPDGTEVNPKRQWLWSKERVEKALEKNEIEFVKNGNGEWSVNSKQYLKDENGEIREGKFFSIVDDVFTQHGTNEIIRIFGDARIFSFPKPSRYIAKFVQLITDENDYVLDFFSGSATTAQSVLELNQVDGKNRKFIIVQMPEKLDLPDYSSISEIGKERIRRVITSIETKNSEEASKTPLFQNEKAPLDLGFKVFKYSRSNFKQWRPLQEENAEALTPLFDNLSDPLFPSWEKEDLLSEILLLEGFPLTSKITYLEDHIQNEVCCVSAPEFCAHNLFVCLDENIQPSTVELLTMEKEDIFVCLDSALSDELKARLQDQFNVHVI